MGTFFLAVVDGFGRLVELAPGTPEVDPRINQDEASDWLLVGDDLWNAISTHPDSKQVDPQNELVEA